MSDDTILIHRVRTDLHPVRVAPLGQEGLSLAAKGLFALLSVATEDQVISGMVEAHDDYDRAVTDLMQAGYIMDDPDHPGDLLFVEYPEQVSHE